MLYVGNVVPLHAAKLNLGDRNAIRAFNVCPDLGTPASPARATTCPWIRDNDATHHAYQMVNPRRLSLKHFRSVAQKELPNPPPPPPPPSPPLPVPPHHPPKPPPPALPFTTFATTPAAPVRGAPDALARVL